MNERVKMQSQHTTVLRHIENGKLDKDFKYSIITIDTRITDF